MISTLVHTWHTHVQKISSYNFECLRWHVHPVFLLLVMDFCNVLMDQILVSRNSGKASDFFLILVPKESVDLLLLPQLSQFVIYFVAVTSRVCQLEVHYAAQLSLLKFIGEHPHLPMCNQTGDCLYIIKLFSDLKKAVGSTLIKIVNSVS